MIRKLARLKAAWVWQFTVFVVCLISHVQPSRSDDNAPTPAVSHQLPPVQLWQFKAVNDAFTSGSTVYLDLTMADGTRKLWNPITSEFKTRDSIDLEQLSRTKFIPQYSPEVLSNGATIKMSVKSTGARCGYAIGVDFTYTRKNQAPELFYIIEKYNSPKKTFYCGTLLKQLYDIEAGDVAVALSDNRILIIDYAKNQAMAFMHVPSAIVALDDRSLLVPAGLVMPGLEAAGDNQGARYRALLATLKSHPAVVIHPVRVE